MSDMTTPIVLTIAGSDSSGGAGIQADIKAISANGCYAASVITALTAQNTLGVNAIHEVRPEFITQQADAVYSDLDVRATKIGMLGDIPTLNSVIACLEKWTPSNVVLDPVMVATSGDLLLEKNAINVLKTGLIPLADLITPNLYEAAELLSTKVAVSKDEMEAQARALLAFGSAAVLLKGGHFGNALAEDFYVSEQAQQWFSGPKVHTKNTHGTGCTLSASIAAHLSLGKSMADAIGAAKQYLSGALQHADKLTIGAGSGPVNHFYKSTITGIRHE